jgi:uncharacterized RmlC-like cupin family protein
MSADRHQSQGVQVVRHTELSAATAQTPGMTRTAAVSRETTGNRHLWVGRVVTPIGANLSRWGAHAARASMAARAASRLANHSWRRCS